MPPLDDFLTKRRTEMKMVTRGAPAPIKRYGKGYDKEIHNLLCAREKKFRTVDIVIKKN